MRAPFAAIALLSSAALVAFPARAEASELVFSAEEVDVDIEKRELRLRGEVAIAFEDFRVASEALVLRELDEAIVLEGPARLAYCDCLRAPVALGFDAATVDRDGDLKLRRPRLEIGGTTVFALPWFWLRPPTLPGFLPPTVAYRGEGGFLLGGGVHLPWSAGQSALHLGLAGYTRGGFELTAAAVAPTSSTRLRWDRLGGDLVAVDALGAVPLGPETALSWEVDSIQGPRARRGTLDLEAAAQAYDRARIETATRLGPVLVGTGMRAFAERGGRGPDAELAIGPRLSAFSSGALGASSDWDALAIGEVLAGPEPVRMLRAEAGVGLSERLGALSLRASFRESLLGWVGETTSGLLGLGSSRVDVGLPLVRDFGAGNDRLRHLFEPRAEVLGLLSHRRGDDFAPDLPMVPWQQDGASGGALASAGFRMSLGAPLGTQEASLEASLGAWLTSPASKPEPLARYRAGWGSRQLDLSFDGASGFGEERGQVLLGRARAGTIDAGYLAFEAAGRDGVEPIAARMLMASTSPLGMGGFLNMPGWSVASEAGTRLLRVFRVGAGGFGDLHARTVLGLRGVLGYEHPCGCLEASFHGQHRLGRPGVDIWANLTLASTSRSK